MKIRIPSRPVHIALFLLLAFLCYQAHQWVRHFTGASLCGGFGTMTFTVATTRQPCMLPVVVALSGPVLTYGLEWLGLFLLRKRSYAQFGYALVFASFGHLRFIQTLTGRGDELILAQQWFGISSRLLVALAVFLIGLPPVIAAFQSIANEKRLLVFVISWLLPLPLLFAMLFSDQYLFQSSQVGMRFGSFLGIWLTVLITDLIAAIVMIVIGPRYLQAEKSFQDPANS